MFFKEYTHISIYLSDGSKEQEAELGCDGLYLAHLQI